MKKTKISQELYQDCESGKLTITELSKKYNISYSCIRRAIINNTLPDTYKKARATVNDNYFEIINTKDKAYFLGLLYADGCVNNSKNNEYTIILNLSDESLVYKFKNYTESQSNIIIKHYKNINYKNEFRLKIRSEKLFKDLNNLGCVERKSMILQFPTEKQVSKEFISHFIRGYFDGDGSIYIKKYNKARVNIAGTECLLLGIQKVLKHLNINSHVAKVRNIFILTLSGTNQIIKFKDFVYKDKSDLFLERKYERFLILEKEKENKMELRNLKKIENTLKRKKNNQKMIQ